MKSKKRNTFRSAVYLFIIRDNKLLLLRRKNTGWKDGEYGLPAGHLETGETVKEAASREAKEEATIEINPKDLQLVHVMHRKANFEYIDLYFPTAKWTGTAAIGEKDLADDIGWFPTDSLPANTIDYMREAFENYQKGVLFSEFGWN